MNAYPRPAFLLQILRYLDTGGVTLTELLRFVLVSRQANGSPQALYDDLVINTKSILSALYDHSATGPTVRDWAHRTLCNVYGDAIDTLVRSNPQWQFIACQAQPEQIRDFRIEDMAREMELQSPMLWSLVHALLSRAQPRHGVSSHSDDAMLTTHSTGAWECGKGVPSGSTEPTARAAAALGQGVATVDSEDEYWEEDEAEGVALSSRSPMTEAQRTEATSASTLPPPVSYGVGTPSRCAAGMKRRRGGRVPQHKIDRIVGYLTYSPEWANGTDLHVVPKKTVVILNILMQNRNQKCNALQSTVGIFLHACNTPEKVIKVLARMGVSVSLASIHRAVISLSEETCHEIRELGQSLLASFGYDNLELTIPTVVPTVEKPGEGLLHLTSGVLIRMEHGVTPDDLRCARLLWDRSGHNPHASDPRFFDPYATMEHLRTLHISLSDGSAATPCRNLTRRGRFRLWLVQKILFKHGPSSLKPHFASLQEPEAVDAIPVVKTHYVPLRTMDLNQSKVSGNIDALLSMFAQAGLLGHTSADASGNAAAELDSSDYVRPINGDVGTYERVLAALRRRSVEHTPEDRLQSVVFVIGLFHLKMAAADTVWRLLVAPEGSRKDETSFMRIVGRLRPLESSRLVANAKFRQQHELISHVLIVLQLDAWRTEIARRTKFKTLEEWASSGPKLAEIEDIAEALVRDYVEGEGLDLFELSNRSAKERDEVRENTMRVQHYLFLYEELCYAMNAGDIGRLETLMVPWVYLFRAAGKHKYGNHVLRFFHALYFVYPDSLRRAIRYNILVNPTGKPHEFRAVDWVVELLNLYTKVVYGGEGSNYTKARIILESVLVMVFRASHANMERNFCLPGLTSAHANADMRATFQGVLSQLQTYSPNTYRAGRKAQHVVGNAMGKGAAIIEAEAGPRCRPTTLGGAGVAVQEAEEAIEELLAEELNVELTPEDISTECPI